MSINEKKINNNNEKSNIEKVIRTLFFSFSSDVNLSKNKNIKKIKEKLLSEEPNSQINLSNDVNKISTNFSTTFQTFSPCKQEYNSEENENTIAKINEIYQYSFNNENLFSSQASKKPKLSLKESRTKLKQLRDKLYPLSEDERIQAQEDLLPVPREKWMMKNLKY